MQTVQLDDPVKKLRIQVERRTRASRNIALSEKYVPKNAVFLKFRKTERRNESF